MSDHPEAFFLADAPKVALPESPPEGVPFPETPAEEIALPETPATEFALPESTSASPSPFASDINRGRLLKVSPKTATLLKNTRSINPFTAPDQTSGNVRRRTNTLLSQAMQPERGPSAFTSATEILLPFSPDPPRQRTQFEQPMPLSIRRARDSYPSTPSGGKTQTIVPSATKIPLPESPYPPPSPDHYIGRLFGGSGSSFPKPASDLPTPKHTNTHMPGILADRQNETKPAPEFVPKRTNTHMPGYLVDSQGNMKSLPTGPTKPLANSGTSSAVFTPSSSDEEPPRGRTGRTSQSQLTFTSFRDRPIPHAPNGTLRQRRVDVRVPVVYIGDDVVVFNLPRRLAFLMLIFVALVGVLIGAGVVYYLSL